jgi:hypothetical protein
VDKRSKMRELMGALSRGVAGAVLCALASSHEEELQLLQQSDAMFARLALADASKAAVFAPKRPEQAMSEPLARKTLLQAMGLPQAAALRAVVEEAFGNTMAVATEGKDGGGGD